MESAIFAKRERRMLLGFNLDSWNNVLLFCLAVAAIAAAFVGLATYATIQLAKQEAADAKREFDEYKLTVEGKVADAKKEGIEAGKTAGNALVRAAELEKQAAELKSANLKLESQIAPRTLLQSEKDALLAGWKQFAGIQVMIESYTSDPEAAVLGKEIADILIAAGVNVTGALATRVPADIIVFGVHFIAPVELNRAITHGMASVFGDKTKLSTTYDPKPLSNVSIQLNAVTGPPPQVVILIGFKPIEGGRR